MKTYKYILLDWDGNLARTLDIWLEALRAPLEKRGHSFSDKEIGANFTVFRERMEALGIEGVDTMVAEADAIATQEILNVELYADALITLEALQEAGKKVALVTTSRHDQIDPLIKKYRLQELFDLVVCGDDVSNHKPHPEAIEKAISLLGGTKEETVMVGDSDSDINGANNAGVDSILFFPPEHNTFYDVGELRQLQPTYIIDDFRRIMTIVTS